MKNIISLITVLIMISTIATHAQTSSSDPKLEIKPYFCAIIVNDIETSIRWYNSIFGLTIKRRLNDIEHGYKIVELESGNIFIELQETAKSVTEKSILKDKPRGTEIRGYFKIGFKVGDMNMFLKHLDDLKINSPNIATDLANNKRNFLLEDPDGNWVQIYE